VPINIGLGNRKITFWQVKLQTESWWNPRVTHPTRIHSYHLLAYVESETMNSPKTQITRSLGVLALSQITTPPSQKTAVCLLTAVVQMMIAALLPECDWCDSRRALGQCHDAGGCPHYARNNRLLVSQTTRYCSQWRTIWLGTNKVMATTLHEIRSIHLARGNIKCTMDVLVEAAGMLHLGRDFFSLAVSPTLTASAMVRHSLAAATA
jgi:hypothetical protein